MTQLSVAHRQFCSHDSYEGIVLGFETTESSVIAPAVDKHLNLYARTDVLNDCVSSLNASTVSSHSRLDCL